MPDFDSNDEAKAYATVAGNLVGVTNRQERETAFWFAARQFFQRPEPPVVERDVVPLKLDDTHTLDEAVGVAMGYASACWDNLPGAGVFESERAEQAVNELVRWIETEYHDNVVREAVFAHKNEAPVAEDTHFVLSDDTRTFTPADGPLAGESITLSRALEMVAQLDREKAIMRVAAEAEISGLRALLEGRDEPPQATEAPETGLSEFGRGYQEGLGERADRELRLAALGHASNLVSLGVVQVGEDSVVSDPIELASDFLEFLTGGR